MSNLQKNKGLLAALLLAITAGFVLALPWGGQGLRAILGAYLVLVAPGFAVTSAILPARRLGTAEHALAAAVTSIAIAVLGGLVLDMTPWGLQPASWAVLLAGITAVATVAALLRMRNKNKSRQAAPIWTARWTARADRLALPLAAVVMVGLALYIARVPAPPQRYQGYTTLWMVPNDAQEATGARIGLQSGEFEDVRYRLEVWVNGEPASVWPGLELEPNQQWQAELTLPAAGATGMVVEAFLYRSDAPRIVYRQARFQAGKGSLMAQSILTGEKDQ
jgi:uncharacterized membrane protein